MSSEIVVALISLVIPALTYLGARVVKINDKLELERKDRQDSAKAAHDRESAAEARMDARHYAEFTRLDTRLSELEAQLRQRDLDLDIERKAKTAAEAVVAITQARLSVAEKRIEEVERDRDALSARLRQLEGRT